MIYAQVDASTALVVPVFVVATVDEYVANSTSDDVPRVIGSRYEFTGGNGVRSLSCAIAVASSAMMLRMPTAEETTGSAATAPIAQWASRDVPEAPSAVQPWEADAAKQIDSLAAFGGNAGFGTSPSAWSRDNAKKVVSALASRLRPSRIVPMADGGVGVVFPPIGSRAARVDITNEEEIVVTLSDADGPTNYVEVASSEVPSTVRAFLRLS